jgi:hypothetical protein
VVFLRWSSTQFAEEVASAFQVLHQCLSRGLDGAFPGQFVPLSPEETRNDLLRRSVDLNMIYSQASFELRVGRIGGTKRLTDAFPC